MRISDVLKKAKQYRSAGLTQVEIGRKLGFSQAYISQLLGGKRGCMLGIIPVGRPRKPQALELFPRNAELLQELAELAKARGARLVKVR